MHTTMIIFAGVYLITFYLITLAISKEEG